VVWNVVPNAGTTTAPKIPASLLPFFGPKGAVCSDTADQKSYGFLPLSGSLCGTLFQAS